MTGEGDMRGHSQFHKVLDSSLFVVFFDENVTALNHSIWRRSHFLSFSHNFDWAQWNKFFGHRVFPPLDVIHVCRFVRVV